MASSGTADAAAQPPHQQLQYNEPTSEVVALSSRMLRSRSLRLLSCLSSSASIALSLAIVSCSSLLQSLRLVMLASCLLDTVVSPCCPCRALLAARASAGMVLHMWCVLLCPLIEDQATCNTLSEQLLLLCLVAMGMTNGQAGDVTLN